MAKHGGRRLTNRLARSVAAFAFAEGVVVAFVPLAWQLLLALFPRVGDMNAFLDQREV